ncbi:hypothetical protein GGQ85_003924 [Nitrobacter vulgaris]|nr:hypothetical protein [Nitrobacter vulgaris]
MFGIVPRCLTRRRIASASWSFVGLQDFAFGKMVEQCRAGGVVSDLAAWSIKARWQHRPLVSA